MGYKHGTILVTGGAGFIGSAMANLLSLYGERVIIIDNLERGRIENIHYQQNVFFVNADLRRYKKIGPLFSGVDIVLHFAAKVGGIGYYKDRPYEVISNNTLIDNNVVRASLSSGASRFVYVSSAHVYPPSEKTMYEDDPLSSCLSYGWGKIAGEKLVEAATQENDNFKAIAVRLSGIYGPNQDYGLETGSVIPVLTHRAIRYPDVPFRVWGTGEEKRTYFYVDDAVKCINTLMNHFDEGYQVFNIGSEDEYTIADIAEKIISISGKDIEIEYDTTKKASILRQVCDCGKAEKLCRREPKIPFDRGLGLVYKNIKWRIENEGVSSNVS